MSNYHLLLGAAAILCVSGQSALLLIGVLALVCLVTALLRLLLTALRLPCPTLMITLFAVAAGIALRLLLLAFIPKIGSNPPIAVPFLATCFLCASVIENTPLSFGRWIKSAGILLFIGCVRELLGTASLFSYPLPFTAAGTVFGQTANGKIGVGGILIAAIVLWVFKQGQPFETKPRFEKEISLHLGLVTAIAATADGLLRHLSPAVPVYWRFGIALLFTVVPLLWNERNYPWITAVIPPVTVLWISGTTVWTWLITGMSAGIGVWVFFALWKRLCRSPVPPRFAGAPCVLTGTALLFTAIQAIG